MSPEIKIGGTIIASVPDETGWHETLKGNPLYVNVDGIDVDNKRRQELILEAEEIGGRRVLGLTHEGILISSSSRRGDNKEPELSVKLLPENRPIRVSSRRRGLYKPTGWGKWNSPIEGFRYDYSKVRYRNPRWTNGHGQR